MTPEQLENLLPKIYRQIQAAVRSATTEAMEQLLKEKASQNTYLDDDLLSAPQAADFLKLKLRTIYSKAEKGELPYSRSGKRKLLFSRKDLVAYVVERKVMGIDINSK